MHSTIPKISDLKNPQLVTWLTSQGFAAEGPMDQKVAGGNAWAHVIRTWGRPSGSADNPLLEEKADVERFANAVKSLVQEGRFNFHAIIYTQTIRIPEDGEEGFDESMELHGSFEPGDHYLRTYNALHYLIEFGGIHTAAKIKSLLNYCEADTRILIQPTWTASATYLFPAYLTPLEMIFFFDNGPHAAYMENVARVFLDHVQKVSDAAWDWEVRIAVAPPSDAKKNEVVFIQEASHTMAYFILKNEVLRQIVGKTQDSIVSVKLPRSYIEKNVLPICLDEHTISSKEQVLLLHPRDKKRLLTSLFKEAKIGQIYNLMDYVLNLEHREKSVFVERKGEAPVTLPPSGRPPLYCCPISFYSPSVNNHFPYAEFLERGGDIEAGKGLALFVFLSKALQYAYGPEFDFYDGIVKTLLPQLNLTYQCMRNTRVISLAGMTPLLMICDEIEFPSHPEMKESKTSMPEMSVADRYLAMILDLIKRNVKNFADLHRYDPDFENKLNKFIDQHAPGTYRRPMYPEEMEEVSPLLYRASALLNEVRKEVIKDIRIESALITALLLSEYTRKDELTSLVGIMDSYMTGFTRYIKSSSAERSVGLFHASSPSSSSSSSSSSQDLLRPPAKS